MPRVLLITAYDGTGYNGSAYQPEAVTIEGVLKKAIKGLTGHEPELIGASRTDAGVHACGNLFVFDTQASIPPDKFSYALNSILPDDIRIMKSMEVDPSFHPRHCNSVKTYQYRIWNDDVMLPVKRYYAWHCSFNLDIEKMQQAAEYLVGTHDFTSFCNTATQTPDHVRTVISVNVFREGKEVVIEVKGKGFLYNMVRIMAGTLAMIGRGKGSPEDIQAMIEARNRSAAGPTAPANGLCLMKYEFPDKEVVI